MELSEEGPTRKIYQFLLAALDQLQHGKILAFDKLKGFEEHIVPLIKEQADIGEKSITMKGGEPDKIEIIKILNRLIESKREVNVYIENSKNYFQSKLTMIGPMVLFTRPSRLKWKIHKGTFLKFAVPDDIDRVMHFVVSNPHMVHRNGNAYILCELPTTFLK